MQLTAATITIGQKKQELSFQWGSFVASED
jgi:hypothetical protein